MVWADTIVGWFEADSRPLHIDATATELQMLGFALVGVFVLVAGLQDLSGAVYVWLQKPEFGEYDSWSSVWTRAGETTIKAVVQIVAGAFLVFGREALVNGWSRLRGTPAEASNDDLR